jgi:sulfur carrier protein
MRITVNGKPETIQPCTLGALVQAKALNADALVVEYNQQIVKQTRWETIQLQENDTLELLSFVGGG